VKPLRKVVLRQWRGRGAPGGWRYTARILNRHGHIKAQFDATAARKWFMFGLSFAEVDAKLSMPPGTAEEIMRLFSRREW
jgi:hypothetical protein